MMADESGAYYEGIEEEAAEGGYWGEDGEWVDTSTTYAEYNEQAEYSNHNADYDYSAAEEPDTEEAASMWPWVATVDDDGEVYYTNGETGEMSWTIPDGNGGGGAQEEAAAYAGDGADG